MKKLFSSRVNSNGEIFVKLRKPKELETSIVNMPMKELDIDTLVNMTWVIDE